MHLIMFQAAIYGNLLTPTFKNDLKNRLQWYLMSVMHTNPFGQGIHHRLVSQNKLSTLDVVHRIVENRRAFELKHAARGSKEAEYKSKKQSNIIEI
jgi:hypothetical protein